MQVVDSVIPLINIAVIFRRLHYESGLEDFTFISPVHTEQTSVNIYLHAVASCLLKTVHASFISFKLKKLCRSLSLHLYETLSLFPPRMRHTINA